MRKKIFRALVFLIYFISGAIVSYLVPDQIKFALGFVFAYSYVWAWKVMVQQPPTIGCTCDPKNMHGETSIMCCNECGKPTEGFWVGETDDRKRKEASHA